MTRDVTRNAMRNANNGFLTPRSFLIDPDLVSSILQRIPVSAIALTKLSFFRASKQIGMHPSMLVLQLVGLSVQVLEATHPSL